LQPQDQAGQRVAVLARSDLAYVELAQEHVDAAESALAPIWELEPEQRRYGLVERLGHISDVLASPRFTGNKSTAALVERIALFTAAAAPRILPPGGPGPALPCGD
jgi:hypothetical protein